MGRTILLSLNVGMTKRLVEASPESTKFVLASSVSVYGKTLKELPADESTPVNPDSHYAISKYKAEQLVHKKKKHVILRISTIYGKDYPDYFKNEKE